MKRSDQDRLLRELLADDSLETFRRESLASGLAAIRTHRRRRAAITGATAGAALLLAFVFVLYAENWSGKKLDVIVASGHPQDGDEALSPHILAATEALRTESKASAAVSDVQHISDEELFALFPGRSMALIGPPGAQQFVFLDRQ